MTTPKSNNPEISPSEFLSSKEGDVFGDNEAYVNELVENGDRIISPERRALGEAVLQAEPSHDIHSYERGQIESLTREEPGIETLPPYDQLSSREFSERVLRIRREMLKGTRKDFALGA